MPDISDVGGGCDNDTDTYRMCVPDGGYRSSAGVVGNLLKESFMWTVVAWKSGPSCDSTDYRTKEEAYEAARNADSRYAIEIYGPNGEYDAVEP